MNEVQLSDSLPVIETEIRQYQNLAGESIFEIGRRLKHVKENDLAHGEWSKWLESIDMSRSQATKFIKVSDEFINGSARNQLGLNAMYLIATLPEEEREKEHKTNDGSIKKPDEMTQKELEELKRQLRERDEVISKREKENDLLQSKLEDAENREPEIIEKYTEPEDYEEIKNVNEKLQEERVYFEKRNKTLQREIDQLSKEMESADENSKKYQELNEAIAKMQGRLTRGQEQIKAQKEVYELVKAGREAVMKISPLSYLVDSENIIDNDYARKPIVKLTEDLEEITQRLRKIINKEDIIGGR